MWKDQVRPPPAITFMELSLLKLFNISKKLVMTTINQWLSWQIWSSCIVTDCGNWAKMIKCIPHGFKENMLSQIPNLSAHTSVHSQGQKIIIMFDSDVADLVQEERMHRDYDMDAIHLAIINQPKRLQTNQR